MNGEIRTEQEKEIVLNELLREMQALREQGKSWEERFFHMEEMIKELFLKMEGGQDKVVDHIREAVEQKKIDLSSLEVLLNTGMEQIKEEVRKQHSLTFNTKKYSIFGDRFGGELFQKVADTSMKWIVALIGIFSILSIVKFLIHYK